MVQTKEGDDTRTIYSNRPTTPSNPKSVMEIIIPPIFEVRMPPPSRAQSRENLTREEYINILAQPHVRPRLSDVYIVKHTEVVPISPRIEELAKPNLRYVRALLYEMEEILSPEIVERLRRLLNDDFRSIYEEADEISKQPRRPPTRSPRRKQHRPSRSGASRSPKRASSAGGYDSGTRGKPGSRKRPGTVGGRPETQGGRPESQGGRAGGPKGRRGKGKGLDSPGWSEGHFKDKKDEWTHTMALKLAEKLSTYVESVDGQLSPTFRREVLEECLRKRLDKMFLEAGDIPSQDTEKLVETLAKQLAVWMEKFMQDLENGGDGNVSLSDIPTLGLFGDAVKKGRLSADAEGAAPGGSEGAAGEEGEDSPEGVGPDVAAEEGDEGKTGEDGAAEGDATEGEAGAEGDATEGEAGAEGAEAGEGDETGEAGGEDGEAGGEDGEGGEPEEGGEAGEGEEAGEGGEGGEDGGPPEDEPPEGEEGAEEETAEEEAAEEGEATEEGEVVEEVVAEVDEDYETGEEGEEADQGTVGMTKMPTTKITADMTPTAVVAVIIRDLANMLEERYGVEVDYESEETSRIVSLREQEIKAFLMENCRNFITSLTVDGSPEWVMRAIDAAMEHLAQWMESVVGVAETRAEERAANEPPAERPLTAEETGQWVGRLEDGVNKALCWVNWLKDAVDAAELRGMQCMRRKIPFSQHVPKDMTWRCCREKVNPRFGKGSWRREVCNQGKQFLEMKKSFTDATEKWKIEIASATVLGVKRPSCSSNQDKRPSSVSNQDERPSSVSNQDERPSSVSNQEKRLSSVSNQDKRASRVTYQDESPSSFSGGEKRLSGVSGQE